MNADTPKPLTLQGCIADAYANKVRLQAYRIKDTACFVHISGADAPASSLFGGFCFRPYNTFEGWEKSNSFVKEVEVAQ